MLCILCCVAHLERVQPVPNSRQRAHDKWVGCGEARQPPMLLQPLAAQPGFEVRQCRLCMRQHRASRSALADEVVPPKGGFVVPYNHMRYLCS